MVLLQYVYGHKAVEFFFFYIKIFLNKNGQTALHFGFDGNTIPTFEFCSVNAAKENKLKDIRNYQNHCEQITWSTNITSEQKTDAVVAFVWLFNLFLHSRGDLAALHEEQAAVVAHSFERKSHFVGL